MSNLSEKKLQNEIIHVFGTRRDIRVWRSNTGVATIDGRTIRFGIPGQADITGIMPDGKRLEIEVKSPTGKQSDDQQNFQAMIAKFGGVYVLARCVEDVWMVLERRGIRRTEVANVG